ncbi:hypothetical protein [Clavibacter michiganensis]|uniref:hypothetical protein n=1 Tax=Clavibacter michiganensis TaxID=28447 RepID=UPI0013657BDF|nr:hypothetical protein [Clavibacter michiganensis]
MSNFNPQELANLQRELEQSKRELIPACATWAAAELERMSGFFEAEGRATVIAQADVTNEKSDQIPELKAKLKVIIDQLSESFTYWVDNLDFSQASQTAKDHSTVLSTLTEPTRKAFGELFLSYGFRATERRNSQIVTVSGEPWAFYTTTSGSGRSNGLPFSQVASTPLYAAWRKYEALKNEEETLRDNIQKESAADIWDS